MEALLETLDNDWTVYVQPHLNGLRPDIVIFSEDAGLGIFEVKDWNLNSYRLEDKKWQVYNSSWIPIEEDCPLKQVDKYKDSIFKYEIPSLGAKRIVNLDSTRPIIDKSIYGGAIKSESSAQ